MPELEKKLAEEEATITAQSEGERMLKEEVGEEDIARVVSRWTGIPVAKMMTGEREKLLHLEDILHKRVIGQDEAVTVVSEAILRARAGIKDPHRPIGSFIFLGPTGVGKTELAKTLAEALFDDERSMIRIDMSERLPAMLGMMKEDSLQRLFVVVRTVLFCWTRLKKHTVMYLMYCFRFLMMGALQMAKGV